MKFVMQGNKCILCRWSVEYNYNGDLITEYFPTEEEADFMVNLWG